MKDESACKSTREKTPPLTDETYRTCLLCLAKLPLPTSGHMRLHYRVYHLVSRDTALDALIVAAEYGELRLYVRKPAKEDDA
jgi:hypothetical protein